MCKLFLCIHLNFILLDIPNKKKTKQIQKSNLHMQQKFIIFSIIIVFSNSFDE